MLPRKFSIGVALGLLVALCLNSSLVDAQEIKFSCAYYDGEIDDERPCAHENDKCYTLYQLNPLDIVGMGCVSDFDDPENVTALIKQKVLVVCESSNCNGFGKVQPSHECTYCSSVENEACATKPTAVKLHETCSMPYPQCYERVTGRQTERGCLGALQTEAFYNCLTNADSNCRICSGDECNEEIVPSKRLQCHRCNSSTSATCTNQPKALGICPVYDEDDACVAVWENGVTKRGCRTDFSCDIGQKNCQVCKGDGCNIVNIEKRTEEVYGAFQQLPLNCYACSGADCLGDLGNPSKCEGDMYQDCLTVFNESGVVVRRGCEAAIETNFQAHCDTNPELCFNCKSNACNTIANHTQYQQCLYCDAAADPACLFKPETIKKQRKCVEGCISSLYPRRSNPAIFDFLRACVEDIDPDDRPRCTAEENCVKCTNGNDCNTAVLPTEGRLTCWHCKGTDCTAPQHHGCVGYSEGDQCFIHYDNKGVVEQMGCSSELARNQIQDDIKNYYVCAGDGCNDATKLSEPVKCATCSSDADEKCAIDPSQITAQTSCRQPNNMCYSRIDEDGHTQRGCLQDLPVDDFVTCHNGNTDAICRICTDDECNKAIYPSNRQQCHRCNSAENPDCEDAPDNAQVCPLYQSNDNCVTKLLDGITHRGCGSELSCDANSNYKNCLTCNDNNCNTVDLNDVSIGDPGTFQELPLNCYHCNGDNCHDDGVLRKCEGNNLQTCEVAFNATGAVVARGCTDLMEAECEKSGNTCYGCKSNGCNLATKQTDYVQCLFCDAQDQAACVFDVNAIKRTRQCHKGCMTALYARSNDATPAYELIRTCLDDMDEDDREACEAGKDEHCKYCSTERCNKDDVGSRKSCNHCSGDGCQKPEAKTCRATIEDDQCFVRFDERGELEEMGCKSTYDQADLMTLVLAKQIWLCSEDNCNTLENLPKSQTCTNCNSRTDPNCAIAPASVTSATACSKLPYTQCYSLLRADGHTERNCLSNLQDDEFYHCLTTANATECQICVGDNCNKNVFPEERLSCHSCDSNSTASCEQKPNSPQVCLKYTSSERCVSHLKEDGVTERGCSSQVSCNAADSRNCRVCEGSNCNKANMKRTGDGQPGMWQDVPLSCHSCGDEAECADAKPVTCKDQEYCMTVFGENSKVIMRGCSDAVESALSTYCDENAEQCHNCNSNNCNIATSLSDYVECVYCDSTANADCVGHPAKVAARRKCHKHCMTALYPRSNGSVFDLTRGCLDDKDMKDQQTCQEGNNHCVACNSAACNVAMLPADRLSCYKCLGADCEDPESSLCLAHNNGGDQCFMLFNENDNDVYQMGCLSDMEDGFYESNVHLLYTCASDNCNGFENKPEPKFCAICDSSTDPQCAIAPQDVSKVEKCTTLPNAHCYTRVNAGITERGCVGSLSKPQMMSCISGNDTDCSTCYDDRCNMQVFPEGRRRCHRCNSKDDPTCESTPDASGICPFYSPEERCAAKLDNGYTYRGCSSEVLCDDADKQYCRKCASANNCNSVDLASINIGYPGHWQDLPISCNTCLGAECADGALGVASKCEGNNLQNCATVFGVDGAVVQRGCSDVIYAKEYAQYCDENPTHCKFCKSNGCNNATKLEEFTDCVFCDGAENRNCVLDVSQVNRTRSCHGKCFAALYPRSSESNPAHEITRGCLDDLEQNDQVLCEKGEKKYCQSCEGATCNKAALPDKRLECYVCEGDSCTDPSTSICTSFREEDQCYTQFFKNIAVRRGCVSDLEMSFVHENLRSLLLCDGENCNGLYDVPSPLACFACNSLENKNCAIDPGIGLNLDGCQDLPYTQCYTHVNEAGVTHRGCLSGVDDELFFECLNGNSTSCQLCNENNCNKLVFPEERQRCLRCNSAGDVNCDTSPQSYSSICPIYDPEDSCVTAIEGDHLIRGCSSDFTCDISNKEICRVCNGANCNAVNLLEGFIGEPGKWQDLPLNCYRCEGKDCADGSDLPQKCEGNDRQTCMTVFGADGAVEKRDCSDAVRATHADYCDNTGKCLACKSNGCNVAKSMDELNDCYYCDSADSSSCSVNFTTARTRKCSGQCMVALYPRNSGNDSAYEMSRSCLDDMDVDDQEQCKAGEMEYCRACEGSRCNVMAVPEERFECYRCQDSDDCAEPESKQCNAHDPHDQCYTLYDTENSIVAMGCSSEYEKSAVTELIKQKKLRLCDGKNCNEQQYLPVSKKCSVCNSMEDPRCATNPNLVGYNVTCTVLPYSECFTRINDGGHTERGCLSSLESDTFLGCWNKTDGLCQICIGDNCNEIDIYPETRRRCHQCSSASDPSCTDKPNSNAVCLLYDAQDVCVSSLANGVTSRGCGSNFKCDNPDDKRNCRTCGTNGCNTVNLEKVSEDGEPGRWQGVPITCNTCKGEAACAEDSAFRVCELNVFQNCLTVFNAEGKVIQRGCSDTVEADNAEYCDTNPRKCLGCNSNGCNTATSLEDFIECWACDTDANSDCLNKVANLTKTRLCHKHCMTALYPREKEENPAYGLSRSCLDDMDLDDRESCKAGDREYCEVCTEAKCNSKDMPATRLSCNVCGGDVDCQAPKPTICHAYREKDRCYLRFDEKKELVAMGCRSELSNAEADYLQGQKRMFYCDGDNCNVYDALPAAQSCTLCNSQTDINCAVKPENVTSATTCSELPYTNCYVRVLPSGATERGCLSSLYDDEFLSCLNGTSPHCSACQGENCNNNVYPPQRRQCHICDSVRDPNCETKPNSLSICPKFAADDTCVTSFEKDVTYRGCSSSLKCGGTDPRTCFECWGDGCNTVDLASKQDDNFGKWQDLPLTCWSCSGDECGGTPKLVKCENNNEQDCVTVFDEGGKVVKRGCSDEVEADFEAHCAASDQNCYKCKSNECNNATNRAEFTDCIYCDSFKNIDCVWSANSTLRTRKCQGSCMTALYPSDASSNPSYDLIRTCLNDKETADQTSCAESKDPHCSACKGARCNAVSLPEDRLSCFTCNGEDCAEPISKPCALYKPDDQCFTWFDRTNSVSQMGCVSSFRNQDLESIIKTKLVYVCGGANCNSLDALPTAQKCAVCDSAENPFCAVNAHEIGVFKPCSDRPYTNCYSQLTQHGTTVRGCVNDLPADEFASCVLGKSKNCTLCTGDGCNREVFPADRQQCYTCSTEDDPDCESFPKRHMPCPVVSDKETCKTALEGNHTIRGCSSSVYCDDKDSSTCRSCIGTGCNAIDLRNKVDDGYHGAWQELPLKCHTCAGEHCHNSLGPTVTCAKNLNQDCMTVFGEDGNVKRRGCADDVEDYEDLYCRLNPTHCFKCKSNECNVAWNVTEYVGCVFCNSETDPNCVLTAESASFGTRSCYKECLVAMTKEQHIVRSCLDDKELYDQHVCQAGQNGKECASCDKADCNRFVFPKDRLKCHVCTGSGCSGSTDQYCLNYVENDICFAKFEAGKAALMGCGSSQNATDLDEWERQLQLYRCGQNDCNELSKLPTGGSCVSCDSSKTLQCAQNPTQVTTSETCLAPRDDCIVRLDEAGNTLRGCGSSITLVEQQNCKDSGACSICNGAKCNTLIFPVGRRKCHICNSLADSNCEGTPAHELICPIYRPNDRCVAKKIEKHVERGCQSELTCDVDDKDNCQICDNDGCNTMDLSGATGLASSSLTVTILLVLATIFSANRQ